jgi:hypothetical protein
VERHRAGKDAGRCRAEVDVEEATNAVEAERHDALEEVTAELWGTTVLAPNSSGARRAFAILQPLCRHTQRKKDADATRGIEDAVPRLEHCEPPRR